MKKFMQRRILPLLLAFSLTVGVVSVASVEVQAVDPVLGAVGAVALAFLSYYGALKQAGNFLKDLQRVTHEIAGVPLPGGEGELYGKGEGFYSDPSKRLEVTEDWLLELQLRFVMDGTFNDDDVYTLIREVSTPEGLYKVIQVAHRFNVEDANGVPINEKHQAFVMYQGYYLCVPVREFDDDDAHEQGKWQKYSATRNQEIVSMYFLDLAREYQKLVGYPNCSTQLMEEGYVVTYMSGAPPYAERMVLCGPSGAMWVSPGDNRTIISGRDETDEDGNENGFDIDPEDMTMVGPDGEPLEIDGIYYNPNTHTYYIDARDQSTNIVYNFSVTYNIQYTNVTYIGQTAEYNKYYEFPYNLPDGRGSADLTAEELEQLALNIDVVPYDRAADDTSLRGLYHFDGDTKDSSYWNYTTGFDWTMGASIVYMDAGVFDGALFMDEQNHIFDIELPGPIGAGDFTIQWRYYQSHTPTAASAPDGYLSTGGKYLLAWDGVSFYTDITGMKLGKTPTGQWMEVALIREGGILYYYVNGVCIGQAANTVRVQDRLTFGFGALQQTYKYFDELRILNKAITHRGEDYTPTTVPHDTNLTLVLPDPDFVAVADEYWIFNAEGNKLDHYDFTNGFAVETWAQQHDFAMADFADELLSDGGVFENGWHYGVSSGTGTVRSSVIDGGNHVQMVGNTGEDATGQPMIYAPIFWGDAKYTANASSVQRYNPILEGLDISNGTQLTGTLMLSDGTQYSVTHTVQKMAMRTNGYEDYDNSFIESIPLPNGGELGFYCAILETGGAANSRDEAYISFALTLPEGQTLDVVYAEIVAGAAANTGHEFVSNIVGVDGKEIDKATLAVRTDLSITGYQIGGVRPTVPQKGLVWALVEGGVIKSLQIYNGSAWEAVEGRIWTGVRWIPYSAFDVLTMKDMYDITGVVTPDDYEYIYTESGFWSWWQKSWLDFVTWIQGKDDGSVGGSGQDPGDALPDEEDPDGGDGWKFVELLLVIRDGLWDIGTGLVWTIFDGLDGLSVTVVGIGDYFDCFKPGGCVFGIYNEGVDVWD